MKKLIFSLLFLLTALCSFSTKYYPVKGGDNGIFLTAPTYDTVVFTASQNPYSYIFCNTSGTALKSIVFINEGGTVQTPNGFNLSNCHYIKITGTGAGFTTTGSYTYGFYIHDGSGPGIDINHHTDHIEIEHLGIVRMTYFYWVKQEVDGDITLNYPNTPIHDIVIHDCYNKGCQQDGGYVGSTGPTGDRNVTVYEITSTSITNQGIGYTHATVTFPTTNPNNTILQATGTVTVSGGHVTGLVLTFNGDYNGGTPIPTITGDGIGATASATNGYVVHSNYIPGRLYNIAFYNNYIDSTGRTGIQFSGINAATSDFHGGYNEVYNNIIKNTGFEFNASQGSGIFNGGMASMMYEHDNTIDSTWDHGIFSYGVDTTKILNNNINHTGYLYGDSGARDGNGNLITHSLGVHRNAFLGSIYLNIPFSVPTKTTLFLIENNTCGVNTDKDGYKVYVGKTGGTNSSYAISGNIICNSGLSGADPGVNYSQSCIVSNQSPIANAGADTAITAPSSSITLNGSGSDPDGTIVSHTWSIVSGSGTITTPSSYTSTINGLTVGQTIVKLTVVDNSSASSSDSMVITVNPAANIIPTANAGRDTSVSTLTYTLQGSGTDIDGTIVSYAWTKISGPGTYTLSDQSIQNPVLTFSGPGAYVLSMVTTDNSGGVSLPDTVSITKTLATNIIPVADAGADVHVTTSSTSVTLNGSGSYDSDGQIVGYTWSGAIGNPPGAIITTPNSYSTTVTGFIKGTYIFQLIVTDDRSGISLPNLITIIVSSTIKYTISKSGVKL